MTRPMLRTTIALAVGTMPTISPAETLRALTSVQFVSNVPYRTQAEAARMLGVAHVRVGIRWNAVERPKYRYVWQPADARILPLLRGASGAPIITLFGSHPSYGPAGSVGPPTDGDALAGFVRFAVAAVKRYGVGTPADPVLYEIWNEPNTKTFWGSTPDPEGYARMATAACRAIKAAEPRATVIALAMEGTPVKAPYFVKAYNIDMYQQWADRAATAELMRCADGFSMHPYLPLPETNLRSEPALARFVAGHWTKPRPPLIVNSEWGYGTNVAKGRSLEDQARRDLRALLIGAGLKRRTNLYQSVDDQPDASQPSMGLVTYAGTIKPAGLAVQRLLRLIGDFEVEGVAALAGQPDVFEFTARTGRARARIVWNVGKPVSIKAAGTSALDLVTGAPRPLADGALLVDESPVLLMRTGD